MLPVLQVGSLAIPVPRLALLLGVWAALWLSERDARRLQLDPDAIYTLLFIGLVAGLVGARLDYVLHYWSVYWQDPVGILSLNAIALAPTEGALIGVTAALVYGARRQLPLRTTLDALAPWVATMAVAVAVAHVASGDAFGAPTALPWRVYLCGEYRHPSQIYELIGALLVLGLVWRIRAQGFFPGFNFLLAVGLSAAARVFLEAFRGDSLVLPGGWREAQVLGLFVLAVCLGIMRHWGLEPAQGNQPRGLSSLPSAHNP